jgi:DNA-directed RNA polymerase specialized sigma24 family protein
MTSQQFEKLYTANETGLKKTLARQDIYDDDLFQDTCLALCEHLQDIAVEDFRQTFLDKYDTLVKRVGQREIECVHFSNVQLAALEIIDDSQDIEILDRHIDYDLEQFTAECTCSDDDKERLQQLLDVYYKHPQPGERNHKRACKILKLYLEGKSEREIANCLRITHQTVHQYLTSAIARLKTAALCKYYRGA